ncbi:MAG: hypothetical protein NC302_11675 [Bacteroidales bacterium]|nr:hypothetical protein [Bacteroidales bacterium]MCM1416433.1 hypothetical protein [bacterium]MCM1423145.1 hypothetical protein [bacterium]
MSKRKKLYLARRMLAMILAAAMSVTMLPSTALAVSDNDLLQITEMTEENGAPADDAVGIDDADTLTEGSTPTDAGENKGGTEDNDSDTTDSEDTDQQQTGGEAEANADDTPAPAAVYEIVLDDDFATTAEYRGSNPFAAIGNYVKVTKDGAEVEDASVTVKWQQKGADGNYADMATGTAPVNVGSYQAVLTYPKQEGMAADVTKTVECEITKSPVTITVYDSSRTVKPGTAAKDVKAGKLENYNVTSNDNGLDPENITLTVSKIRDAMTDAEIGAEELLKKSGDYVMDITPSFSGTATADEKQNYELKDFSADLIVENLIETKVEVELDPKWKEKDAEGQETGNLIFSKDYDGEPIADPVASVDYTYKVQYYDDNSYEWKDLAVTSDKIVGEWFSTDDIAGADEDGKKNAPTKAGSYTYRVSYVGEEGIYAPSNAAYSTGSIAVEIKKAELKVELKNYTQTTPITVVENSSFESLLAGLEYKVTNKAGEDVTEKMKAAHVWGTSYNDRTESQVYEPWFTVEVSTDNGTTWDEVAENDIWNKFAFAENTKYRVAFRGKKATVYVRNGYYEYDHIYDINDDVNGFDSNYYTSYTTIATSDGKEVPITVTPGKEAEIDVTALVNDYNAAKEIKDLTAREYNGEAIFKSRSQYKNAVALKEKEGAKADVKTESREFTYTWEKYCGNGENDETWNVHDLIDAKIAVLNAPEGGAGIEEWEWDDWDDPLYSRDAGVYRLTISYTDLTDSDDMYYYADDAVVYFAIDPKQVKIVPTTPETPYKVMAGSKMGEFIYEQKPVYEVKDTADQDVTLGSEQIVYEKIIETIQDPAPAEPYDSEYVVRNGWEEETFGGSTEERTYTYQLKGDRLYKKVTFGTNLHNYYYIPDLNYTCQASTLILKSDTEPAARRRVTELNTASQPIEVVPMGTAKLTITVDSTKWVAQEKVYDAKPFTEAELIPEGLVSVSPGEPKAELTYRVYPGNEYDSDPLEDVTDAGTYDLYVCFAGDENYAPYTVAEGEDGYADYEAYIHGRKLGTFRINPKPITLTADLDKTYPAGTTVSSILTTVRNRYQAVTPVPGEEYLFDGWVWQDNAVYLAETGSKVKKRSGTVERNKSYEVRFDDNYNNGWMPNYEVQDEPIAAFEAVPGNSTIASTYYSNSGTTVPYVAIQTQKDASDSLHQTVTILNSIDWTTNVYLPDESEAQEGNFVAFRFTAPAEFDNLESAMYENAIKAAGGYVSSVNKTYSKSFVAVFKAGDKDKEIKLRWADGYYETYTLKFKAAVKLPNLANAVAAKALAFNAANKKMAVGVEQQLDVKITKEQMGDIICLGYESSDPTTLAVNEDTGNVIALKKGSATITVYPRHLVNGELKKINGAKTGSVKITVTNLDAPKKLKAVTHGSYVNLYYNQVSNGYRREIYVVEKSSSFKTAANFESVLKNMKENRWQEKGFAIAPRYVSGESDDNSVIRATLSGLDAKKDYTIYVRNVCAVRTLGSEYGYGKITQAAMSESAAGAVLNVKTKKTEVTELSLGFYDEKAWVYDEDGNYVVQYSALKNGTIQCTTYGYFPSKAKDEYAESGDRVVIQLPFDKAAKAQYKNDYEEPKLEYALKDCYDKKTDTYGWGTKNDYASIDKKGKLKITGFPETDSNICNIRVRVRDVNTGTVAYNTLPLLMEEADSVMAAKGSVTYTVGQGGYLADLLAYKLGKQKLTAYPWHLIDLAKVRKAISDQKQEDYFTVSDSGYLRAVKGGGTLKLELTDKSVERLSGTAKATAKVTIKSKDLEAVKGLKAYDVTDQGFGLRFSYTGAANQFLLEVSDAKKPIYGKVISSSYIDRVKATDKNGKYIYKRDMNGSIVTDDDGRSELVVVKNSYEIPYRTLKGLLPALTKETQYKVTLTPIYGACKAKPATAKVKTTKIPAADRYLDNEYYTSSNKWIWGCDKRGGIDITVSEDSSTLGGYYRNNGTFSGTSTLSVTSGNTYTLTAETSKRGRVNDTLIWTVGDAKVAKVKAAAGTYTITLTGVKPGTTTLEVKSKLLGNKVIARCDIKVSAVGKASDSGSRPNPYYGENEPE